MRGLTSHVLVPKKGQFVIADRIEEGDKVKAEMVFILYKDQIKHLKRIGAWYGALVPRAWAPQASSVALQLNTHLRGLHRPDTWAAVEEAAAADDGAVASTVVDSTGSVDVSAATVG